MAKPVNGLETAPYLNWTWTHISVRPTRTKTIQKNCQPNQDQTHYIFATKPTKPSAHMWVKTILVNGLKLFALKNQKRVLRPLQARSASSPLESPMPHFLPK
jgi:hypothetical protein